MNTDKRRLKKVQKKGKKLELVPDTRQQQKGKPKTSLSTEERLALIEDALGIYDDDGAVK